MQEALYLVIHKGERYQISMHENYFLIDNIVVGLEKLKYKKICASCMCNEIIDDLFCLSCSISGNCITKDERQVLLLSQKKKKIDQLINEIIDI